MHRFLSVTGPKFWLDKKSIDQNSEKSQLAELHIASNSMMAITNSNTGMKSISHVTGRCALFNVKLHFFPLSKEKMKKKKTTRWLSSEIAISDGEI